MVAVPARQRLPGGSRVGCVVLSKASRSPVGRGGNHVVCPCLPSFPSALDDDPNRGAVLNTGVTVDTKILSTVQPSRY